MKFKVNSTLLLKKINIVAPAIGSNPILPILEDFLFSIKGSVLTITATDLDVSITSKLDVISDADGAIAIPAKILIDTLKALPNQELTFSCNAENGVSIKSQSGNYKMMGENGADYPILPEIEDVSSVTIESTLLQNGIIQTLFATSNDDLRPAMTGVYFEFGGGKVRMTATDAHKLAHFKFDATSEYDGSFIIPKKALSVLKNNITSGDITVIFGNGHCLFEFNEVCLSCRMIDQKYPDYNAVIPIDNPNIITINRVLLQSALKRISIYANKTTNQVIFNLKENQLTISAQDLDFSNEASEIMVCNYGAEEMTIGFNAKFLIEILGVIDSDDIKIELSTPTRAVIIKPLDANENYDIQMLAMPVMLSN